MSGGGMPSAQVAALLDMLPLGDNGRFGSLRHLALATGDVPYAQVKHAPKEKVVLLLTAFYCAPGRFGRLWDSLSAAERKMASLHIWSGGTEPMAYAYEVAEEFNIPAIVERRHYYYARNGLERFMIEFAQETSALWLLFPRNAANRLFESELREAAGEMPRAYTAVSDGLAFVSRENRTADFTNIVKCCNAGRLSVTKGGWLSKASALKLRDFCGYEEFAADTSAQPEEMRTADGLLATLPLTVYGFLSGLLSAVEGTCVPGSKSLALLRLPHAQLVRKLLAAYLRSRSFDEISLMRGIKAKRGHNPADARSNIAEELKRCPVGQAVYTRELERHLRIANGTFARREEKYVTETGNACHDFGVDWTYYEHPLIYVVLTFCWALGIIDVAWGEETSALHSGGRRVPLAFRINPLGAYALGLSDAYSAAGKPPKSVNGGFTVLPDYTVVVPESADRLRHELYFERLFSRVASTDEASIFRLDFETVVRALDSGLSIASVREYLSASDRPLPDNVAGALGDWQKQSDRIRIRRVTILECDDEALLEEVIRYRGMGEYVKEKVGAAVVVEDGATARVKKAIEKNKRFCKDVL